jgi:hypothetical protein
VKGRDMTDETAQENTWGEMYDRIYKLLQGFGTPNSLGEGDYWVFDDNWGIHQHKVEINNLDMLEPRIIKSLQALLRHYPGWEIVVAIDITGKENQWPPMGLILRRHEIIDGLQRSYFPPQYQSIHYDGSRPGTDRTP